MIASRHRNFDTTRLPLKIISGPGARLRLDDESASLGARNVLIVASPSLARNTSFIRDLTASLGTHCAGVFTGVAANNPAPSLDAGAILARGSGADLIVSIGGGAAHDAAKAIALMVPNNRPILDLVVRFGPDGAPSPSTHQAAPLPVFTIPATFSAAEMVGGGGVTDPVNGRKLLFAHPDLSPRVVFLDGDIAATIPREILLASGLNAVHHCLESIYSLGASPISDALAQSALATLLAVLPGLKAADASQDLFQQALDAAGISGLTYANSSLGIGHAVCHVLGGRFGLPHASANAVIVLASLRFNRDHAIPQLARAARACGIVGHGDLALVDGLVKVVQRLTQKLGTPTRLRDIGFERKDIDIVAREALQDWVAGTNPRPVTFEALRAALEAAW